jgi:thymidine kinase
MFSGKSEELSRRLRRAKIARKRVLSVKHSSDDRYDSKAICSHSGGRLEAVPLGTPDEILTAAVGYSVIGIDEAQFFPPGLVGVCEYLANQGKRVLVAGLDQDSDAKPFGPIPHLMVIAESVTKLTAICMVCGESASRSYHKAGKTEQVEVGASAYEARCRACWNQR